jgi:NAD(P)-dependent dehydrogenase (short-subunit alcohol dehydrogenase family)
MSEQDLSDLAAVVTGGASGIGLATVRRMVQRGARVAALDLSAGSMEPEPGIEPISCDVTDQSSVDAAIAHALRAFGHLDVCVNNAGIGAVGTVTDNDDEEWHRVFDVNVVGIARLSRAVLPHLRRSPRAAIVNTCSVTATVGLVNRALYSASKGAVLALTFAMAADLIADHVRVNCVNPGTAGTPWVERLLNESKDPVAARASLEARQPMGRLATAEEIAEAICFLASPSAAFITGISIAVDGGLTGLRLVRA